MNIFMNFVGHEDAATSLHILFEERLGYKIYVPGDDKKWSELGINNPIGNLDYHGTPFFKDGIKHIPIFRTNFVRRPITVEQFMDIDFDLIVISTGSVEIPFHGLAKKYKPNSIFIRQIPNIHEKPKVCRNVLLATKTPMPSHIKFITHHPEHPHQFKYVPYKSGEKTIKSFSNYLRNIKKDAVTWDRVKVILPEFKFFMHGAKTDDRTVPHGDLHLAMQDSMFIWHTKIHGGCGFVAREALSCGRPLIVKKQYCKAHKTLAQDYLVDGVNCIDLSIRDLSAAAKIIREWSRPGRYEEKCKDVLRCFDKHINFEREAQSIRRWISTLRPVSTE